MNAEKHLLQTFLGIMNCRLRSSSTIGERPARAGGIVFPWRFLRFPRCFLVSKKVTVEKGVVPRGLSQPRAGRPLRGIAVCLEPLLEAVAVIACLTDTATG